jgi:Arc/MetJ family transcription regulator
MRTNIELNDDLVQEAMRLTGAKSKREVVELGLKALVRQANKKDLFDLVGQIDFAPDFDHKETRRTRYDD